MRNLVYLPPPVVDDKPPTGLADLPNCRVVSPCRCAVCDCLVPAGWWAVPLGAGGVACTGSCAMKRLGQVCGVSDTSGVMKEVQRLRDKAAKLEDEAWQLRDKADDVQHEADRCLRAADQLERSFRSVFRGSTAGSLHQARRSLYDNK